MGYADPEVGIGYGYVTNRMGMNLQGDPARHRAARGDSDSTGGEAERNMRRPMTTWFERSA